MRGRVSIGLPVYNGGAFLPQAIESILAQEYDDFELIIADNASTDHSMDIASDYAAADSRISIHRADRNRGAVWNFNRCVHLATGHYFRWAAHDDIIQPAWLSRCVEVMDSTEDIVLCYTRCVQVDPQGHVIRELPSWCPDDSAPRDRVAKVLLSMIDCTSIFGLTRRAQLLKTQLHLPYGGSDRALLAQLALMGRFHELPEFLFHNREHIQRSGGTNRDRRVRVAFLDPTRNIRWVMPRWRLMLGYAQALTGAPAPPLARMAALSVVPRWAIKNKGNLAYDFVRVLRPAR